LPNFNERVCFAAVGGQLAAVCWLNGNLGGFISVKLKTYPLAREMFEFALEKLRKSAEKGQLWADCA